ncbi:MAG TPA: cytochrome c oxidase subunit 3 [Pyrinomonadaceae bacterium]|nr:cytochrome c oxidase subunit 3 [Pyrinomonadaceae bacterium]
MSLQVGTAETTVEEKKKLKKLAGLSGGSGSNGGKRNSGGGGNGGDNSNKNSDYLGDTERYSSDKFRIAMWFLLLVVLMTFGGLVGTYIVLATNNALEWEPFNLPKQVWFSTFLIVVSSLTYIIAQKALDAENQIKAKNWFSATTALGAIFISSQILSWAELVNRGVYVAGNPYAGFFYILTAVHALHVIGGICALGYIVLRIWNITRSDEELATRKSVSNVVGWYWHFMGGLWIVLFLLLGFFK